MEVVKIKNDETPREENENETERLNVYEYNNFSDANKRYKYLKIIIVTIVLIVLFFLIFLIAMKEVNILYSNETISNNNNLNKEISKQMNNNDSIVNLNETKDENNLNEVDNIKDNQTNDNSKPLEENQNNNTPVFNNNEKPLDENQNYNTTIFNNNTKPLEESQNQNKIIFNSEINQNNFIQSLIENQNKNILKVTKPNELNENNNITSYLNNQTNEYNETKFSEINQNNNITYLSHKTYKKINSKPLEGEQGFSNMNKRNNIKNSDINEGKNLLNNQTIEAEEKKESTNITGKMAKKTIISENNTTDYIKKIKIAFVYSTLFSNGIARFITVTANNLIKTGKYDIYLITGKPYHKEYSYDKRIKRFVGEDNDTVIRNISKNENIDIFILQNLSGPNTIKFYRSLGKKVIGMFHGVYMSAMFHDWQTDHRNWLYFDLYDSFIFIAQDDYYFYKKLGFKNEIFIPNIYTFEPSQTKSSNLTGHNIIMLGRLNDEIKGVIYAIKAMSLVAKEVPDARLLLITSDYRVEYARNLSRKLNITNNIIINYHTYNISELFWNSSIHMYTSLCEAFPMAMIEGKAHGLPIVAFDVPISAPYQSGVITVDLLDYKALARETIKLLKDYNYRKKMGEKAKLSLNRFYNNETVELWGRLFDSLLSKDRNDYRKLQNEIEKKYYNEKIAEKHIKKHYDALLRYNNNFTCHHLENFTDVNYIKNIKRCNFTKLNKAKRLN